MFKIRFLIAESSKGLQTYVRQLFEDFGFDSELIKTASHPEMAFEIAKELKPDFLLTDWFAKETLTGIDLHQAILAYNAQCQFALLSTVVGPEQMEQASNAGALFLQIKPCSAADLRTALGKALQQLSQKNPKLDSHVNAVALAAARHLAALTIASKSPTLLPGDKVVYKGRTESVKNAILRKGEMVVQLDGVPGMIAATQVLRV